MAAMNAMPSPPMRRNCMHLRPAPVPTLGPYAWRVTALPQAPQNVTRTPARCTFSIVALIHRKGKRRQTSRAARRPERDGPLSRLKIRAAYRTARFRSVMASSMQRSPPAHAHRGRDDGSEHRHEVRYASLGGIAVQRAGIHYPRHAFFTPAPPAQVRRHIE